MTSHRTTRRVGSHDVEVTNLDKEYFPAHHDGPAITKGQVIDYYERIGDRFLDLNGGRPMVVQRFPDGIDAGGFYQKNLPDHAPDWIDRVEIATADGGTTTYAVVDDPAGIVYLANQGAIVFHTLLADAARPERPVEVNFDLDPADADTAPVRAAAKELRVVLDGLGLAPRVKTSGSRGLHIVVDVTDRDADFDLTRRFVRRVAETVVDRGEFTLEARKARRRGRLYLDIGRNAPAAHAVAPWSLRASATAPVAVPLDWDEALAPAWDPRRITIANVFRRLAHKPDPWARWPEPDTTIADALAILDERGQTPS